MGQLIIFCIEEKARQLKISDQLVNLIAEQGFDLLEQTWLNYETIATLKYFTKWEKFKSQDSALLLIAYDFLPIFPNDVQKQDDPTLDNIRILTIDKINRYCQDLSGLNEPFIYSLDNAQQSWELLYYLESVNIDLIKAQIQKLSQSFMTDYPIKKNLSSGWKRRSKVELIEYQNSLAVKKTFKPGCERFFRRELLVHQKFSQIRREIPPLLDYGQSFLITPYYEDTLCLKAYSQQKIPWEIVKQTIKFLYFFYRLGYALIDFHPGNFMIDKKEGLKATDFEFLYTYANKPNSFAECYDLAGIPPDFSGDKPLSLLEKPEMYVSRNYDKYWKPYTHLDLEVVLENIN
ncbi:MAG: hypothetical protein AB4058_03825 [Microcystaceae cyanobacterium]